MLYGNHPEWRNIDTYIDMQVHMHFVAVLILER